MPKFWLAILVFFNVGLSGGDMVLMILAMLMVNSADAKDIRISTGVAGYNTLLKPIEAAYEKESGGGKFIMAVDLNSGGLVPILQAVAKGDAEVAFSPGQWKDIVAIMVKAGQKESDFAGWAHRTVGHDYLKVFANKDLSVKSLKPDQLEKVFAGEITNWKELGGPDLPIVVVLQTAYKATNAFFKSAAMPSGKDFSKAAVNKETVTDMVKEISEKAGAIGFASKSVATANAKEISLAKEIGRPILGITRAKPSASVEKLFSMIGKK